ncbi:hypothetical protein KKF32_03500 [Patescibacteria group bacterium]|nr:hypothetical protein [Patescibacteria group bacterium]
MVWWQYLLVVLTVLVSIILALGLVGFILWRFYHNYKSRDRQRFIMYVKDISKTVESSDSIKEVKITAKEGEVTLKGGGKSKRVDIYPHAWPAVIAGKPFKAILKIEKEKGEIVDTSFLAYWVAVEIDEQSGLKGKNLYFEYNLVPDQYGKSDGLRFPMDSYTVEEGQILGWVGECNELFIFIAKIFSIFGIRLNVLNDKLPITSPANGIIYGKYVEDYELVKEGENLFTIYYLIPHDEQAKEESKT